MEGGGAAGDRGGEGAGGVKHLPARHQDEQAHALPPRQAQEEENRSADIEHWQQIFQNVNETCRTKSKS